MFWLSYNYSGRGPQTMSQYWVVFEIPAVSVPLQKFSPSSLASSWLHLTCAASICSFKEMIKIWAFLTVLKKVWRHWARKLRLFDKTNSIEQWSFDCVRSGKLINWVMKILKRNCLTAKNYFERVRPRNVFDCGKKNWTDSVRQKLFWFR